MAGKINLVEKYSKNCAIGHGGFGSYIIYMYQSFADPLVGVLMVNVNISIARSAQLNWYNLLRSIGKETEASAFQELVITEGNNTRNRLTQ